MNHLRLVSLSAIGALAASLALTGCDRREQSDARTGTNGAVASVDQKTRDAGADAKASLEKGKDATANATAKVGDKIDDAVITSSVKTELAKNSNLSALKINVDTDRGRVALKGTAPNAAAREQATLLAQNVKGVVSVDNQLKVQPDKM